MALKCTTGQRIGGLGVLSATTSAGTFTYSCWIKVENPATGVIAQSSFGGRPIHIATSATQLTVSANLTDVLQPFTAQAMPSGWFHLALRHASSGGTRAYLYINGVEVATIAGSFYVNCADGILRGITSGGTGMTVRLFDEAYWGVDLGTVVVGNLASGSIRPDGVGTVPNNYYKYEQQTTGNVVNGDSGLSDQGSAGNTLTISTGTPTWDTDSPFLDITAPTLSARTIPDAGTTITATLSESGCLPSSGTGGFTLSGTSVSVSSWAISGTTLTLTLSGSVIAGETVLLSYARASTTDDIYDTANNYLADFTNASVTNNSTQTGESEASVSNKKSGFRSITSLNNYLLTYEPLSVSDTDAVLLLGGRALALKQLATDEYVIPYLTDTSGSVDNTVSVIQGKTLNISKNNDGYYFLSVDNSSVNKTVAATTLIGNVNIAINSDNEIAIYNIGNSSSATDLDTVILGNYRLGVGKISDKWYLIFKT